MLKKIAFCILLSGITTTLSAQSSVDTTKYYLPVSKYTKSIEHCVSEFQKWDKINSPTNDAFVTIKTSLDEENHLTLLVEQAWNVSIETNMPDYYSYILGVPVFWYMGKSNLIAEDTHFREFLLNRFSTHFYTYKRRTNPPAPSRITKEEFEQLSPYIEEPASNYHNKVIHYPSFVIKTQGGIPIVGGGRTVRIDRIEKNILR